MTNLGLTLSPPTFNYGPYEGGPVTVLGFLLFCGFEIQVNSFIVTTTTVLKV